MKMEQSEVKFEDFDVLSETWSTIELEDKSIIRFKTVLMALKRDISQMPSAKGLALQSKLLATTYSLPNVKGHKGQNWSVNELEKHIIKPNLMFRQLKNGISEYKTSNEIITINTRAVRIDKTNKFQRDGQPAYIIRTEAEVIIAENEPINAINTPIAVEKTAKSSQ